MADPILLKYHHPVTGVGWGLRRGDIVHELGDGFSLQQWLINHQGRVAESIVELESAAQRHGHRFDAAELRDTPDADTLHLLPPIDVQEVWAAGVTYERSREARQEESVDGGDVYARVYNAERPELFFKSTAARVVGPGAEVGIRKDATWNVPEPELTLVFNPSMEMVGYAVGNDMSSRDIEGENPLYLPQAKVYTASCALGPGIALRAGTAWPDTTIRITIYRDDKEAFSGDIHTDRIKRTVPELADYLGRMYEHPNGVMLMTGTGVVPPNDFTLEAGDVVEITIDGVGTLRNRVIRV